MKTRADVQQMATLYRLYGSYSRVTREYIYPEIPSRRIFFRSTKFVKVLEQKSFLSPEQYINPDE